MKENGFASFLQVKVGSVAEQIRGVSYSKDDARSEPSKGFIPVLRANNVSDEGLVLKDFVFIPHEGVQSRQLLRKGDILVVASSGSLDVVGRAAMVQEDMDAGFGAFCKVVRPNSNVDSRYLAHFFRTPEYRRTISSLAGGANINNLRGEHIDDLLLPLPSVAEQKRLAAILDHADGIRRKRQQALRLADDFLRSVFLDMFGDPVTNPKGWKTSTLGDLVIEGDTINYGVIQPGSDYPGGVPLVRAGDINAADPDVTKLKQIDPEIDRNYDRSRLHGGEVLIGCVGAVGATCIAPSSWAGINIARAVARIRLQREMEPEFILALLRTEALQRYFAEEIRVVAQPTLNIKQIKETPIMVPPATLRKEFASVASRIIKAKERQEGSARSSEDLFQSLQHRAFTGQL